MTAKSILLPLLVAGGLFYTTAFAPLRNPSSILSRQELQQPLFSTPPSTSPEETKQNEEPLLSELDARVLKEMLQDTEKLDLQEESNMKKLLERGIAPKSAPTPPKQQEEEEEGPYSSETLKVSIDLARADNY